MAEHHVILVEDERLLRNCLLRVLRRRGFAVNATATWRDALQVICELSAEPHQLILVTDLLLPDGSALQLLGELEARHIRLPVILMSGYMDFPALDTIAPNGSIVRRMTKPFEMDELLTALDAIVATGLPHVAPVGAHLA